MDLLTLESMRLKSKPEGFAPMFVDGVFNPDNWNGGDGIIRYWANKTFYGEELPPLGWSLVEQKTKNWSTDVTPGDENTVALVAAMTVFWDQTYLFFCHERNDENDFNKTHFDIYFFSWYKERGRTEVAQFNGKPMTEEQYCKLLTMLGY